jgi:hypothetical protein
MGGQTMMKSNQGPRMDVTLTTEGPDGVQHHHYSLELTFEEQRKVVEASAGGPCFRMWISDEERKTVNEPEWCMYRLSDGRWALWRLESDYRELLNGDAAQRKLAALINSRRLGDNVI